MAKIKIPKRLNLGPPRGVSGPPGFLPPEPPPTPPVALLYAHDDPAIIDGITLVGQFETWLGRGRKNDAFMDFLWYESWANMETTAASIPAAIKAAGYPVMIITVGLVPDDGVSTIANCAAGTYDTHFTNIATSINASYPAAIIRLAHEFNLPFGGHNSGVGYPWAAALDPTHWVSAWRRVQSVMKGVSQQFKFDWCYGFDLGYDAVGHVHPDIYYPGDDVVDYVGLDFYNKDFNWIPFNTDPVARWQQMLGAPVNSYSYLLNWHKNFAKAHGKKMTFPEWGTASQGNGDDSYWIQQAALWIKANNFAYHGYWDSDTTGWSGRISLNAYPNSAAAYKAAFGQ